MAQQAQITPAKGAAAVVAAAIMALGMIAGLEGDVPKVYKDPIGIPTVCYGHTGQDVKMGDTWSDQRCLDTLKVDAVEHAKAIAPCIKVAVPRESLSAFVSFSFNVGPRAFCKSTLVAKLNAGDLRGACAELSKWTKAGGRVWPGLVERRRIERAYCERGLS